MTLKLGDRVRMLHAKEEGVVVKIGEREIEFETTDGFLIPVLRKDLVKVSEEEQSYFKVGQNENIAQKAKPDVRRKEELLLGFETISNDQLRPYLINYLNINILFVLSIRKEGVFENIAAGQVALGTESRLYLELKKSEFEKWNKCQIQLIRYNPGEPSQATVTYGFQLKAARLFAEKRTFGPEQRIGYFQVLDFEQEIKNYPEEQPVQFFEPNPIEKQKVIDLHAETMGIQSKNPAEIKQQQFEYFLKEFDLGIANYLQDLTVIHGVGNQILRHDIHQYLSRSEHINWFKDAQKEKFGYGATHIRYKS